MDHTTDVSAGLQSLAAAAAGEAGSVRPPFRVLVAEDNPIFESMLCKILGKWGYQAISVRDGETAWKILQSDDSPRMAVLDWMMPGLDGVEVCRRVRNVGREPYTYIVLLTARTESEDLIEAMDAGADDYLTKPFRNHELRVRLRAGRRILDLQEELLRAREALRVQATHDALTGLHNRASVLDILHHELARSDRENQPVAVLLLDLDRFKHVNDAFGHPAGDAVLRETAQRIKSALREYDSVGRYGGEEFLVVLPGCGGESAYRQAERVREAVGAAAVEFSGSTLRVSCSIGLAYRDLAEKTDACSLIREADVALYVAKNLGRNQVAAFATERV
ncbi:MAG TPA: diguanylate cyclase [Verrucomicrobiae bacterium]|nr:diguanylate cyclase [Verrucomicrobiae bacterium]